MRMPGGARTRSGRRGDTDSSRGELERDACATNARRSKTRRGEFSCRKRNGWITCLVSTATWLRPHFPAALALMSLPYREAILRGSEESCPFARSGPYLEALG